MATNPPPTPPASGRGVFRKLPLIPTVLVAVAVAVMIGLGVWQLRRADEKQALLAQYRAAQDRPPIGWPVVPPEEPPLFRRATGFCLEPTDKRVTAGRNLAGEPGYVHIVHCRTGAEGPGMAVQLGWSRNPQAPVRWDGGAVHGMIAPDRKYRMRLVADRAPPGLQPSEMPSIDSIPNNHLAYAVQWFLFACIAVVIYLLAVRARLKSGTAEPKP